MKTFIYLFYREANDVKVECAYVKSFLPLENIIGGFV